MDGRALAAGLGRGHQHRHAGGDLRRLPPAVAGDLHRPAVPAAAAARLAEDGVTAAGNGPLIGMQVASFPTKPYRDWPDRKVALYPRLGR